MHEVSDMTPAQLESLLKRFRVSTRMWGKNGAKTINDLCKEVNNERVELRLFRGTLVRFVDVVEIELFCEYDRKKWQLFQTKQILLPSGAERIRNLGVISEKVKRSDASVDETVSRALREEVPVLVAVGAIDATEVRRYIIPVTTSPSYPGLLSRYNVSLHRALLTEEFICMKYKVGMPFIPTPRLSFVTTEEDVETYFEWRVVGVAR